MATTPVMNDDLSDIFDEEHVATNKSVPDVANEDAAALSLDGVNELLPPIAPAADGPSLAPLEIEPLGDLFDQSETWDRWLGVPAAEDPSASTLTLDGVSDVLETAPVQWAEKGTSENVEELITDLGEELDALLVELRRALD